MKRDCLSSNFETTKELLGSSMTGYLLDENASLPSSVPVLPWVPQTTAAVALRLMDFDASISYMLQQKVESHKDKEAGEFIVSILSLQKCLTKGSLKTWINQTDVQQGLAKHYTL